jgi:periplasmic protein TonB
MKKLICFALLCGFSLFFNINSAFAQSKVDTIEDKSFTFVEEKPKFPGGEKALKSYLKKNVNIPEMAKKNGAQGKVFVSFVVEKDGSVSEPKVVRGIGNGCDDEAVRVVKSMPKWSPAKLNGQPVKIRYTIPIVFK